MTYNELKQFKGSVSDLCKVLFGKEELYSGFLKIAEETDYLWDKQPYHINRILRYGIKRKSELCFILENIYLNPSREHLPVDYVFCLVKGFEIVLNRDIKNRGWLIKDLSIYFPKFFEEDPHFDKEVEQTPGIYEAYLKQKLEATYQTMSVNDWMDRKDVQTIAESFLFLVWAGEFTLSETALKELTRLLRKWI
jgi:hypothetical protein